MLKRCTIPIHTNATLCFDSAHPNAYARKQSSVEAGILLSPPPPIILMYIADKINFLL